MGFDAAGFCRSNELLCCARLADARWTSDERDTGLPAGGPLERVTQETHHVLAVHESDGRLVADIADTEGMDVALTFPARAGAEYVVSFVPKVKLEIIAADDSVGNIIEAIGSIARTGRREDCRIAIRPYLEVT